MRHFVPVQRACGDKIFRKYSYVKMLVANPLLSHSIMSIAPT